MPESVSPNLPGRLPGWETLWGSRIPGSGVPPRLVTAVALLSLAGLVGALAPEPSFIPQPWSGFLVVVLPWTRALLALLVAGFAWSSWLARGGGTALLLATILPGLSLLGACDAFFRWESATSLLPMGEGAVAVAWLGARLLLALGLHLAWAATWLRRRDPAVRQARLWRALFPGAAVVAAAALLPAAPFWRPGWQITADGVVLLLIIAALPAVAHLYRREPGLLSHCLLVSLIPQIGAQLTALSSSGAVDSASLLAQYQTVLAYLTLLAGVMLDFAAAQRAAVRVQSELRRSRQELESRDIDLHRVTMELASEQEKKESYQRRLRLLEMAVERMSVGVTICDPDNRIIYVNPADAAMHGYSREELLGRSSRIFGVVGQGGPPPAPACWQRDTLNRAKDGRIFPVRLISDVLPGEDGRPQAIVTLCEDITEMRRAREAVERRDRVLAAVGFAAEEFLAAERWPEGVPRVLAALGEATDSDRVLLTAAAGPEGKEAATWSWSRGGGDEEPAAPASPELWRGLDGDDTFSGRVAELSGPAGRLFGSRGTGSVAVVPVTSGGSFRALLAFEAADERREWAATEMEALRAAARTLGAALQRQEVLAALAAREADYRQLVEGASDLIQSVGPDGRFRFVNPAWLETLGYSREEVAGLTLWDLLPASQQAHCRAALDRLLERERQERIETVFRCKSGTEIQVEGSVGLRRDQGRVVATIGVFRDVTERRRVERMKQEFLATVSHELRTPLTSILGSLDLLRGDRLTAQPERARELLEIASRNGDRLLRLINDLLDLQRLEAGELRFQLSPVHVGGLLEDAVEGIQGFADLYNVRVRTGTESPAARLITDRDRLAQVIYNLLSNAIKFSPAGEEVLLTARADGDVVEVAVRDHGPGIPEEFKSRLFEKFAQAEVPTARRHGGAGLGLSISKRLVEGLGGTVQVESSPGAGTTLTVRIPSRRPETPPA